MDVPPLLKRFIIPIVSTILIFFPPFIAHEAYEEVFVPDSSIAGPSLPAWHGFENQLPKNVNKIWYQGNGSCMPYARYRSGIPIMGSAGTILDRLPDGVSTSTKPKIGDVLVTDEGPVGHVAVVEDISSTTIVISEQNYKGPFVISSRTIPLDSDMIIAYITD